MRRDGPESRDDEPRGQEAPFFTSALKEALRSDCVVDCVRRSVKGHVYLVGGVLRNLALGLPPGGDYDFVLEGEVEGAARGVAAGLGGTFFLLDKSAPSYRVVIKEDGRTVDFSPMRGGSIEEDLAARDFTVNAMAVDLVSLYSDGATAVIDPSGGAVDAGRSVIRAVSKGILDDDPVRGMRAVRLAQRYSLSIDGGTGELIREKAGLTVRVSPERVRDELVHIFSAPGTAAALRSLYDLGLMETVLPEVSGWEDIGGGYDLLGHTLSVVSEAEGLASSVLDGSFPSRAEELVAHFEGPVGAVPRTAFLKMAALFHDTGKRETIGVRDGRLRFIGHEYEGSGAAREALRRLRFSRRLSTDVATLVKNHHRVFTLAKLERPSVRARAHLFRAMGGELGVDLLCLALADARATRGGEDPQLLRVVTSLLEFYYGVFVVERPEPILSGDEVMEIFGVPEGRIVGEILGEISRGVEEGFLADRKDAVEHIRRWLRERRAF